MKRSFRYVHEPMRAGDEALPPLGNDVLVEELQSRIRHSRGGAFLITGFRGVGKSTLVVRALDEIAASGAPADLVLPVSLSVARSTTTEQLLFAVVRRVFETLSDSGVLDRLPAKTRSSLLLAYMRTSLAFKEMQSEARERAVMVDLNAGAGKSVKKVVDFVVPKVSMSNKRTQSMATEAAFLAYSETDVEHDLMRIVSLVDRESDLAAVRRGRLRALWPWPRPRGSRLHLVIVLDEVDKLTADETGLAAVEELLSGIKNILTMPGAHFLIVAGPDLHDRAVRDAARGNGVYESVFGWRMYVPCSWDAPDTLVADVVAPDAGAEPEALRALVRYLRFKARGVPRRLLQEFNGFVVWEEDSPRLLVDDTAMERVEFYARLEEILDDYFELGGHGRMFPVAIDEDRWRLGGYYVMDWVLQSGGDPFGAADLLREGEEAEFDPLLRLSRRNVDRLLEHLVQHRILEIVRQAGSTATVIGDIVESGATVYRLAEDVARSLYGFAAHYESERAAAEVSLAPPWDTSMVLPSPSGPPSRVIAGRYELSRLIGQGGMGTVHAGLDLVTGREVAVKLLRTSLQEYDQAVVRARREADIAMRLRHPQIVRTYDVVEGPDGSPALVMEFLDGPTLSALVTEQGPMSPSSAALLGRRLAEVLDYMASQRVVRLDMKPSNIIMSPRRGPVLLDLGIARSLNEIPITSSGVLIGTPSYMAPEGIEGRPLDSRADLYSLGIVLYYSLTGRSPWDGADGIHAVMFAITHHQVDLSGLPVSAEFRQVLSRTVALDPDDRFPHPADFRRAIEAIPELRESHGMDEGETTLLPPLPPMPIREDDPDGRSPRLPRTPMPPDQPRSP